MIESLALIILVGLFFGMIMSKLKLPRIIGMLFAGIIIGPYALNLLDESILSISSELRQIALIIILIKAGLSLDLNDLKKVGRPAILMSFVPAIFEIVAYTVFAPMIIGISYIDAMLMGAVLAAVSPAVVIPRMVSLTEMRYGTKKGIPQMIMAGASCDDIFVIVLFTSFLGMTKGEGINLVNFVDIPISIVLGILFGMIVGYSLAIIFDAFKKRNYGTRNTTKLIVIMGFAFLMMSAENILKDVVSISGLLAVVAMSCTLKIKCKNTTIEKLSSKVGKMWLVAEIMLFVLVGAAININYTLQAGGGAFIMILVALIIRAIGVCICMIGTNLTIKEKLFCIISYLPKATVQAAIGSVPLSIGLDSGQIILSVAVLGILITAPLGAIGIDLTYNKLLTKG